MYRSLRPNCEEDEQVKNTLCSIFTLWMDFSPDDFYEPRNRDALNELMRYAMLNMPSSDLLLRLHILLEQLEEPGAGQPEDRGSTSLCGLPRACEWGGDLGPRGWPPRLVMSEEPLALPALQGVLSWMFPARSRLASFSSKFRLQFYSSLP
ncbi:ral guanine nucleotide dissociation stimulator-like [Perognathus longimembris pacificus]|uniref:ral guanine nucleotide dissociation stimulator-like n=1 Tax=Perognathus longimembris pacificus TaxID=214514 RepID=UPI002019AE8C|nr:ral guanine nucleotide dissociation stimulator-like [Perognathus longimembris pacificus]